MLHNKINLPYLEKRQIGSVCPLITSRLSDILNPLLSYYEIYYQNFIHPFLCVKLKVTYFHVNISYENKFDYLSEFNIRYPHVEEIRETCFHSRYTFLKVRIFVLSEDTFVLIKIICTNCTFLVGYVF